MSRVGREKTMSVFSDEVSKHGRKSMQNKREESAERIKKSWLNFTVKPQLSHHRQQNRAQLFYLQAKSISTSRNSIQGRRWLAILTKPVFQGKIFSLRSFNHRREERTEKNDATAMIAMFWLIHEPNWAPRQTKRSPIEAGIPDATFREAPVDSFD